MFVFWPDDDILLLDLVYVPFERELGLALFPFLQEDSGPRYGNESDDKSGFVVHPRGRDGL